MKTKKIVLLLFFAIVFSNSKAQTLYLRTITGTQTSYPVVNIKNFKFSGGNLLVNNTTGANGTFALSSLRYFNFTDLSLATTTNEIVKNSFYLYPNPVSNTLYVTNADKTQTISHLEIISLEGRLLLEQNSISDNEQKVEVSSLPKGIYLCKITANNKTQTIKFLKQ
jgi:hypothetical protein